MKSIKTTLIASSLLVALSGVSLAQTTAPAESPRAAPMQKMREHSAERHAQHLTELKSKLNLSSHQDAAWKNFSQAMQAPNLQPRPERAAFEKMTTPERIDHMQAMKSQRDAIVQKRAEATKVFYGQLTAEQKKTFDAQTMGFMQGMGAGMQTMRHGHAHTH